MDPAWVTFVTLVFGGMAAMVGYLYKGRERDTDKHDADQAAYFEQRTQDLRAYYEKQLADKDKIIEAWMAVATKGDEALDVGVLVAGAALHAAKKDSK